MMKFLLHSFSIAVLTFLASLILPWWIVSIVALILTLCIHQNLLLSILAGFFGGFVSWFVWLYVINQDNEFVLAENLKGFLGQESGVMLLIVCALLGGISGALGAWVGYHIRKLSSRH